MFFVWSRRNNIVRTRFFNLCFTRSFKLDSLIIKSVKFLLLLIFIFIIFANSYIFGAFRARVSLKFFRVHFRKCFCDHSCTFRCFMEGIWLDLVASRSSPNRKSVLDPINFYCRLFRLFLIPTIQIPVPL